MSTYGYDSRRRQRPRQVGQDARDAVKRVRRHLIAIILLAAVALVIIGWDHETRNVDLYRPAETDVTTTLPPSPNATTSERTP